MYLGSADIEGTYQAFKEILNNSTDEALAGYGKKIIITVDEDNNEISLRDFGRGVPFGIRDNGENVLVSIYTKSHTGGKFGNENYKNASGLNGVGGSCVCLSSLTFEVISYRDGKKARALFKKGENTDYKESAQGSEPNGTYVCFSPDPEVFSDEEIGYSYERICDDVKAISYLYPGLEFVLIGRQDGEDVVQQTFCAKNGIVDFIKDNIQNPLNKTIISTSVSDENDTLEIAFQWGKAKEKSYVFVNGLLCPEGGSPITGAKAAITKTFNGLANEKFDGDKIREGLLYVINCKVANPSFANQTKSKVNNGNLRTLASNAFTNALKKMKEENENEFNSLVEMMRRVAKADEAAERAREAILSYEKNSKDKKKTALLLSDKLKDCRKHDENSMLGITEGDSALGSMVQARDINNVALMPIRGKIISALKHDTQTVLANEEVKAIFSALNCGIFDKYDSKKLRYGKVGIMTDADKDGLAIGCLLIALFYHLCPRFLQEGRLYWIRMPLYVLNYGKNKIYYAFDENERDEFFKKYGTNCEVSRKKGLGENTVSDNKIAVFGEQKRWEQLVISDWEDFEEAVIMMMGRDTADRKKFVMENVDFSRLWGE